MVDTRDSSFNMGIAHLTRIDTLLYYVVEASQKEDYTEWHRILNILSREIFFLFSKEELDEEIKLDNICINTINNLNKMKTSDNKTKAYNSLVNYELFIKRQ